MSGTDTAGDLLRVLRRGWWIIVLCALAGGGLLGAYAATRAPMYEAEARLLFGSSAVDERITGVDTDSGQPERDAATQVALVTSRVVGERVRERVGADEIPEAEAEAEPNADVLRIVVTSGDAARAAEIADAYAEEYVAVREEADRERLESAEASLRADLARLPRDSPEREAVAGVLERIITAKAVAGGDVRVLAPAEVPERAASPMPIRDTVVGVVLGLAVGISLAFARDVLDRRIRDAAGFERAYGVPVLAGVPQRAFDARKGDERAQAFEPYRILRAAVTANGDPRVLLVTSAMPEEGKTTVAYHLARAFALGGERVVLVEADLRRPGLGRFVHLADPGGGLTTALVAGRDPEEMLRAVSPALRQFSVLPSGPLPPNAAELLASGQMTTLLAQLGALGARVVLDAPPLLPVADAQVLLDQPGVDGVVIIGRAGRTTREQATRARAVLERSRLTPIGVVACGVSGALDELDYASSITTRG